MKRSTRRKILVLVGVVLAIGTVAWVYTNSLVGVDPRTVDAYRQLR